jgi:hypothetical protein
MGLAAAAGAGTASSVWTPSLQQLLVLERSLVSRLVNFAAPLEQDCHNKVNTLHTHHCQFRNTSELL